MLPAVPHVAVFDTAFFHNLPAAAATYAIDRELAEKWHIRRYGFHGTSHRYVSEQAAAFLGRPWEELDGLCCIWVTAPPHRRSPVVARSTPRWD